MAPNTKFIDDVFRTAVEKGASDIHIVEGLPPVLRIDGDLQRVAGLPPITFGKSSLGIVRTYTAFSRDKRSRSTLVFSLRHCRESNRASESGKGSPQRRAANLSPLFTF